MIDLKEYGLITHPGDTVVYVVHLSCGDQLGVANMDEALEWAGSHVCGQ